MQSKTKNNHLPNNLLILKEYETLYQILLNVKTVSELYLLLINDIENNGHQIIKFKTLVEYNNFDNDIIMNECKYDNE